MVQAEGSQQAAARKAEENACPGSECQFGRKRRGFCSEKVDTLSAYPDEPDYRDRESEKKRAVDAVCEEQDR